MVPAPIIVGPPSVKCARCAFHIPEICESPVPAQPIAVSPFPEPGAATDEELIRRHQIERERALRPTSFGLLFERHHRHVVAWICRITRDLELSRDLTQDVFVKVFTRLHAFRAESKFTTWLYSVARNCFHDYLKARAARPREVGGEALLALAGPIVANAALSTLEREQARRVVSRVLHDARLTDVEKHVVAMHYRDEMPLATITVRLGLANASGAKAQIVSAKRKLHAAADRWSRREHTQALSTGEGLRKAK